MHVLTNRHPGLLPRQGDAIRGPKVHRKPIDHKPQEIRHPPMGLSLRLQPTSNLVLLIILPPFLPGGIQPLEVRKQVRAFDQ